MVSMADYKISVSSNHGNLTDTAIYMDVNSKLAAVFYVSDAIRLGAKEK